MEHPAIATVRSLLASPTPSEDVVAFGDLVVQPLTLAAEDIAVMHIREALREGLVDIEELEHPEVERVRVRNKGVLPVFFPVGAVVTGGGQTRMVSEPTLVLAGATAVLPVRCVEARRWTAQRERVFHDVRASPLRLRSSKSRRDSRARMDGNRRADDQGETWDEVACHLASRGVSSGTSSLLAAMDASAADSATEPVDARASGVLAASQGVAVRRADGGWLSWDLFGAASIAEHGVAMAIESVELETASRGRCLDDPGPTDRRLGRGLPDSEPLTWSVRDAACGTLVDFALPDGSARGTAMVYEGIVLQATIAWAEGAE